MYQSLKERGQAASDFYAGSDEYFYLSPAGLALLRALTPVVAEHCRGRVLDAGAGRGAYRNILMESAEKYVGMDVSRSRVTGVIGDAQRLPFLSGSFDTVFCSQVLEHVPEPWLVLAEFRRVLKPGGKLIMSVPHISWLHNEPHDYYRYTVHGLSFLLGQSGLKVKERVAAGGLISLLGHIISTLLVSMTFGIPVVHRLSFWLNRLLVKSVFFIDSSVEKKKIFALNYIVLAEKCYEENL